ncbi:MAG TPA: BamA/TamA family outer membrane protein [Vicinamibacterales bacterium]
MAKLLAVCVAAVAFARPAGAQHFGKNKVEYVDFDFKVFETEHFAVYHYAREEAGARIVSRLAERWYARLSRVLEHTLEGRQPLILYGSQPEFAQTNVVGGFLGEGVGGVTESARRRIVMPFAPTLSETDRILGHELTHAFQFDIARRYRGGLAWPLWAVEGLAQYLSLGASDGETALWLRDAVAYDLLPKRQQDASRKFSPYRYGHAFWAYIAGRFGDRVIPAILKAKEDGSVERRIKSVTGVELDDLFADWRKTAYERHRVERPAPDTQTASARFSAKSTARLYLGPSISPDGSRAVFFSEKDRVSLDLFLADTSTGAITRKLASTAASVRFESLQAIRSAGSWSPEGTQFVFAAIQRGEPALVILDMTGEQRERVITLPQFGQILTPAWSPDGRAIAFAALEGGLTDLYVYDLASRSLRAITNDPYSDLHPEWSPDGRRLAFITDRYSTDLTTLRFGPTELALADVRSGAIERLPAIETAAHFNPQWSADGTGVYFLADPGGVSNVHRIDLDSKRVYQVTTTDGAVGGLTPTSPALSVARSAPVLAFSMFRKGRYDIEILRGAALAGTARTDAPPADVTALSPTERTESVVAQVLSDDITGLPLSSAYQARPYVPKFFLEAVGTPYISSGGGPFGTYIQGGGSFLFSDLLGERKVAVFAQGGNRMRDLAMRVQFLNREHRWNWGAIGEVQPSLRRLPRIWSSAEESTPSFTRETHYFERTQVRMAALVAYPFDRAQRIELEAGARYSAYRRTVSAVVRSMTNGRILSRTMTDGDAGAPTTAGEASAAYVRDTSVFGPTGPILGGRSRIEVATTFGELSATRVLLDHRRYLMPIKPYTVAMRLVHLGQYGRDADDVRVLPSFLGSRYFLHGYGWGSIKCQQNAEGACAGYDELLGSRLVVGNLEVRAPILGVRSRDLRYGPVPAEGFIFADGGLVWSRAPEFSTAGSERRLVRSFGIGVRVNALGLPLEWAAVRATDPPAVGWSFGITFRPAF